MRTRTRLFLVVMGLIMAFVICLGALWFTASYKDALDTQREIVGQGAEIIANDLQYEFDRMNSMSQKIIYSMLSAQLIDWDSTSLSEDNLLLKRTIREFAVMISDLQSVHNYEIVISHDSRRYVYIGPVTRAGVMTDEQWERMTFLEEARDLRGQRLICKNGGGLASNGNTSISLCRAVSSNLYSKVLDLYIEVRVSADWLLRSIESHEINSYPDARYAVLGRDGTPLLTVGDTSWIKYGSSLGEAQSAPHIEAGGEIVSCPIRSYGFDTAVWIPEATWNAPAVAVIREFILFLLLCAVVSAVASHTLADRLTHPLVVLSEVLANIELDNLPESWDCSIGRGVYEYDVLNRVISSMIAKLRDSLEATVAARTHWFRTKLYTLQSQINPHFLYNTLSVIQILAKREGATASMEATSRLAAILRYSLSSLVSNCKINTHNI